MKEKLENVPKSKYTKQLEDETEGHGDVCSMTVFEYGHSSLKDTFYNEKMNEKDEFLTTTNTAFKNSLGQIALYRTLTPAYDNALYSDQFVFMPYEEFGLAEGNYVLKYDVDLLDESGNLIQHFTLGNFTFTK